MKGANEDHKKDAKGRLFPPGLKKALALIKGKGTGGT